MNQGVFLKAIYNDKNIAPNADCYRKVFESNTCVEYRNRDGDVLGVAEEITDWGKYYPYVEFRTKDGSVLHRAYIDHSIRGCYVEICDRHGHTVRHEHLSEDVVKAVEGSRSVSESKKDDRENDTQKWENDTEKKVHSKTPPRTPPEALPAGPVDLPAIVGVIIGVVLLYLLVGWGLSAIFEEPVAKLHRHAGWMLNAARFLCVYAATPVMLALQYLAGRKEESCRERWVSLGLSAAAYVALSVQVSRLMIPGGSGADPHVAFDNIVRCFIPLGVFGIAAGLLNVLFRKNGMGGWNDRALRFVSIASIVIVNLGYLTTFFACFYDVSNFFSLYDEVATLIPGTMLFAFLAKLPYRFFGCLGQRFR